MREDDAALPKPSGPSGAHEVLVERLEEGRAHRSGSRRSRCSSRERERERSRWASESRRARGEPESARNAAERRGSPRPTAGKPSVTAKREARRIPYQKRGTETPSCAKTMMARSASEPSFRGELDHASLGLGSQATSPLPWPRGHRFRLGLLSYLRPAVDRHHDDHHRLTHDVDDRVAAMLNRCSKSATTARMSSKLGVSPKNIDSRITS